MQGNLDLNSIDQVIQKRDLNDADPTDLALAYMIVLESGIPDSSRFSKNAENILVANLMEIRRPAIDRLYQDLVSRPILPILDPNSPLRVAMRIWGQRGEVYQRWAKLQQNAGLPPLGDTPPSRNRGEWAQMPGEFWTNEDIARMPSVRATTREEMVQNELYKQRYRAFHNLPSWADTEFDPDLDLKIRLCLSSKMRDAGPMGTAFGLAAMLRGGTPEDVMAAIDLGSFGDTAGMAIAGRGQASNALNSAFSYTEPRGRIVDLRQSAAYKPSPPMPLSPVLMNREQYAKERVRYGTGDIFRHTLNKGGAPDIFTNQRLMATPDWAGQSGVRAYNGPFVPPYAKGNVGIEFTTPVKPGNYRRWFGSPGHEWLMDEGEYLPITIINVIGEDGVKRPYEGPPKPPSRLKFSEPPVFSPRATKPDVPGQEKPPISPHPAGARVSPVPQTPPVNPKPAARKLTMRELMVAELLTRDWQSTSGIYLQTGIPDAELVVILEMLVAEGYAEKQADPQRAGSNLYRATPEWAEFLKK